MGQCAAYKTKNIAELFRAYNNLDAQSASYGHILAFITKMLHYCQCGDSRHNKNEKEAEKAFEKPQTKTPKKSKRKTKVECMDIDTHIHRQMDVSLSAR